MAKKQAAPLIGPHRHMRAPVEHAMDRKAACLRLMQYFRAERWRVAILTLIVAISVAAGVSAPVFMSWAIDAITAADYDKVPGILSWMFGACALYAVLLFFQGRLSARLSQSIIRHLRKDLFEKINGLPLEQQRLGRMERGHVGLARRHVEDRDAHDPLGDVERPAGLGEEVGGLGLQNATPSSRRLCVNKVRSARASGEKGRSESTAPVSSMRSKPRSDSRLTSSRLPS